MKQVMTIRNPNNSKRAVWTGWILTTLSSLLFVFSAVMKLAHAAPVIQTFKQMGIPESAILPIGIVELSCAVLYVFPRTAVLGTFLLTGYLGGITLANVIVPGALIAPLVLGAAVWFGAWLRVPDLRRLVPILQRESE